MTAVGASPRGKHRPGKRRKARGPSPSAQGAFERALARLLGGGSPRIVWTDAGDEVLVHLESLRATREGACLIIALDLEADEIGRERVEVRFALGRDRDGQIVGATDANPARTDAAGRPLAGRWGEALQDGLWSALVLLSAGGNAGRVTFRELQIALGDRKA